MVPVVRSHRLTCRLVGPSVGSRDSTNSFGEPLFSQGAKTDGRPLGKASGGTLYQTSGE